MSAVAVARRQTDGVLQARAAQVRSVGELPCLAVEGDGQFVQRATGVPTSSSTVSAIAVG
jgi:hypothetical protein